MKVFVSHSSKQKLFVREFASHKPGAIDYWIDEKAIIAGQDFKDAIDEALSGECEFVALIVDDYAAESEWVRYEIEASLKREEAEGRTILIPIVLSADAWIKLEALVGTRRKYISCFELTDNAIRAAARSFIETILEWLVAEKALSAKSKARDNLADEFANAEKTFKVMARELKAIIYPHRRENPISIGDILKKVNASFEQNFSNVHDLQHAITELFDKEYMSGYFFDGEIAFLAAERFVHKAEIDDAVKQQIARRARLFLADDMKIAIDGGSTTLTFANEIARLLVARAIVGLQVFTNSIPVARTILEALNDLNASERDSSCTVHIMGGRCRHNSMCSLWEREGEASFAEMFPHAPNQLDFAFVGASGLNEASGFGITHSYEIPAKTAFKAAAARVVVLSDGRKFEIPQPRLFAPFNAKMIIITDNSARGRIEALASEGSPISSCEVIYVGD